LKKNEFLDSNLKIVYFPGMKNLFKRYIIDVLRSMINIHM